MAVAIALTLLSVLYGRMSYAYDVRNCQAISFDGNHTLGAFCPFGIGAGSKRSLVNGLDTDQLGLAPVDTDDARPVKGRFTKLDLNLCFGRDVIGAGPDQEFRLHDNGNAFTGLQCNVSYGTSALNLTGCRHGPDFAVHWFDLSDNESGSAAVTGTQDGYLRCGGHGGMDPCGPQPWNDGAGIHVHGNGNETLLDCTKGITPFVPSAGS